RLSAGRYLDGVTGAGEPVPARIFGRDAQVAALRCSGGEENLDVLGLIGCQLDRRWRRCLVAWWRNDRQSVGAGCEGDVDLSGLVVEVALGLVADRHRRSGLIERGARVWYRCACFVVQCDDKVALARWRGRLTGALGEIRTGRAVDDRQFDGVILRDGDG